MRTKILKAKRDESIHRILDAAMDIFSEVGYEGARIDEIAKRAGVNKAMIYYRIGDKKTLYEEVIHDVFGDIAERINDNIKEDLSPEDKFNIYIANIALTMSRHPAFPKIMLREMASGWSHFSKAVIEDIAGVLSIVRDIIDEGVKKGVFIEINPVVIHLMVVGTLLVFNGAMPVRQNFHDLLAGPTKIYDNDSIENIIPEIQRLMLRGLKA
jgi:TetR/AcrR family transcriptional regulator